MTQRVLLGGYYGAGNTGDEAILTVLLRDLRALRPELQFVVVSADPDATAALHRVPSVGGRDIPAIIDAARESDLVLLGGGGVFHDYWGCAPDSILTRRAAGIPFYAGFPLLAGLTGRPSMICAAGVGPLHTDEGRRLTRAAFEQASVATVRDVESRDLLADIGVVADVGVTADPAFDLRPDLATAESVLTRLCPQRQAPLVAVCLRNWMLGDSRRAWEAQMARGLDAFVERTQAFIVFVPFQDRRDDALTRDVEAASRVIARMARKGRAVSMAGGHGPATLAGILARCDVVVGMRLHALVFAASAGVPAVGLAYDPKVTRLMTRIGLGDHALELDAVAGLGECLATTWARRDVIRPMLAEAGARLRALAAENIPLALDLLDGQRPRPSAAPTAESVNGLTLQQIRRLAEWEASAAEPSPGGAGWRVTQELRSLARRLAPPGTRRGRAARIAMRTARTVARERRLDRLAVGLRDTWGATREWLVKPREVWALDARQESYRSVIIYADRDVLLAGAGLPRRPLSAVRNRRITVSLIATARNERSSVQGWLASVAAQTRAPDEVVVVDGGSTDGTPGVLQAEAERLGLAVRIFVEPGVNIARGRNLAIERARGAVLASTDLGCRLTPRWLESIVAPFEDDEAIQVVAGWYVALERGRPLRRPGLRPEEVDPAEFLPSSRSIAFTREAWAAVGGYPEWLTLTGEDTWFALELRRLCEAWALVPEAVVEWDAPMTMTEYWRKLHGWCVGDGESGVGASRHWRAFRRLAGVAVAGAIGLTSVAVTAVAFGARPAIVALAGWALVAMVATARWRTALGSLGAVGWKAGGEVAKVTGFLRGASRRPEVLARRHRATRGLVFILSGVPIDDTGGGARCTQLALEFLKQNWSVVFVSRFPRHETTRRAPTIRHPRLFTVPLGEFAWRRFIRDHALVLRERDAVAILEFPLADFLPMARTIRRAGGAVVYDLLDNWDSSLGGAWYSHAVEKRVVETSDVLVATAPSLATRLAASSGRAVALLPNAVNVDLFDPDRPWRRPADYPPGAWSMIYVGALWGDWLDWDLVRRLALVHREAAVVMIGDYRNEMSQPPPNVRFLGLKPQTELPAYLAHADVAIVPWKANPVTHATSPLKVYEYLAMRRPVVAPRLDALEGIPGVVASADPDAFVRNVGGARRASVDRPAIDAFVRENSWPVRVGALLELIALANGRTPATPRNRARAARPPREPC